MLENFKRLMGQIHNTNAFIELYKDIQDEILTVGYYKALFIVRAYQNNNMSLVEALAAQIHRRNQREALQQIILYVRDVEVIRTILRIFDATPALIKVVVQYWLYVYEEYYDYYITNIWYRMRPEANSMENMIKILDMMMSIHKPDRLDAAGCLGYLFIGRHYGRCRISWVHVLKQKTEHKLMREIEPEDILYLIDWMGDSIVLRNYLLFSKLVVPKTHSLYSIYLDVHRPRIEYTKKIWERIGLTGFNTDMVA